MAANRSFIITTKVVGWAARNEESVTKQLVVIVAIQIINWQVGSW